AGQMLSRGTTKLTRTQLSDELERLKVSGRVGGTGGSFQTTRPNLEEALKLAAHVLKEPAFPESEFEQLRNQTITSIQAQLAEPNARASEALSRHFNAYPKGDWRYAPTLEESIEAVKAAKLDDVKRFHREFYGAGVAEIAIVGDFDEARVAALVQELFAGWKAQKPWARVPVQHGNVAAANLSIATPDKENAILLARQNLDLRDDDPDYPALFVADYILGGGAGLDSRLAMRLRQKDGLSYAAGSGLNVPAVDRSASWSVYAIAAPANIAKAEAAMKEELARALAEGFTEAELAAAKSGTLQTRLQTRAQDGALAGGWAFYLHHGRTFAFSKAFEDRLQALTLADVNAAVRKHLDPARLTIVKAGDFK
ncbi:MAG TPA: pitrilysin family protein, partial [Usitatibacteraceae bacterium]|nr:pitrilysin family protein [Usitatibacteraceae bacterium]